MDVNFFRIANRVATPYDNRMSEDDIREINRDLAVAIGMKTIDKILDAYGLETTSTAKLRDANKFEIKYKSLNLPVGNAELVMNGMRGQVRSRQVPRDILIHEPEALGFTVDVDAE